MHFDRTKTHRSNLSLTLIATVLALTACVSSAAVPGQAPLPTVRVQLGEHAVSAELANTDKSRQIGLMNRATMAQNSGMLFVFRQSETQCMWMKNTLIDIDVAFADEGGTILNVEQMKAGTADVHCSKGEAKLALEMNRNWFLERGIGPGKVMQVPAAAVKNSQ